MLNDHFVMAAAVDRLRSNPLGPWLDSFVDRLTALGYTPWACRSQVVLAADLGRWMGERGLDPTKLDEVAVGTYVAERVTQHDRRRCAALHLLDHLRLEGVTPRPDVPPDLSPIALLRRRHAEYLREERGASEGTVDGYSAVIRTFLDRRFGDGPVEPAALAPEDISDFLLAQAAAVSPKTVAYRATALTSFLRFLFVREETAADLSRAVLSPCTNRLASVPRYLTPEEVERVLATCDPKTPTGRRNRAILLLLVRLGLRASEVASLDLVDLRWRSGEIVVRGKGNVVDRMPLLPEVGEALASYIRSDRPKIPSRRVFIRLWPPIREIAGRGTITAVVRSAIEKAGLHPPVRGPHLLRHTLGTLLVRAGASMGEIAEVLRHHSTGTTELYAKVDIEGLRSIARPWSGAGGSR